MFHGSRYPRLTFTVAILAPSLWLILLVARHLVPVPPPVNAAHLVPVPIPNAERQLLQISSDPYTNNNSQHQTELEPDTYSYGSTIVAAFQAGRFQDGGSSNIGWATSRDGGKTWIHGFLPGTTKFVGGAYTRITDPAVTYDAAHQTWIISSLAILGDKDKLVSPAILVSLSIDGGITWDKPIKVVNRGSKSFDKDWIVCDNTAASPFYGHCYVEWDDDDKGGLILMSASSDGGHSWSVARTTADKAHGLGGQPLVQPNGTVIVPISGYGNSRMLSFISTNGGLSWSKTVTVAKITGSVLPTAEVDATGKVYLVWADCDFEKKCSADGDGVQRDLVMSTSSDGVKWSPVRVIPVDALGSGVDHFVPGLGVDRNTSGSRAHLALAFYYRSVICDSNITCSFYVGFVESSDGGSTCSKKITFAGPMDFSWLPSGRNKVGDYISTSFCEGNAYPVFSIANGTSTGDFNEAMFTITGGLVV